MSSRMPTNRLPRRALYGELSEGRCSIGQQFKLYKDHLKTTLKKCGIAPKRLKRQLRIEVIVVARAKLASVVCKLIWTESRRSVVLVDLHKLSRRL